MLVFVGSARKEAFVKLYYSLNSNPRLAVAVARHIQAPVQFIRATPQAPDQVEFFRALNPNTLLPVLVESDDSVLWETDAIACRLCQVVGSTFWPSTARLPELLRWLSWGHQHFLPPASELYFEYIVRPTFTSERSPQLVIDAHLERFRKFASILNAVLKKRRWLVDDEVSYADFRIAFMLPFAEKARLPLSEFPEIQRWAGQLNELDAWRDPFRGLDHVFVNATAPANGTADDPARA
jgi:glutathione S-transferase